MNFRDLTYGRELRAYESELAKAAALHQRAVSSKRGRVVFIAGQPKSGRTDLLMSLGRHLAQLKPAAQIIGGRFHSHQYSPATREFVMTEQDTTNVLTEALRLAAELKQKPQQARAGLRLGDAQQMAGNFEYATTVYDEALRIFREIGHRAGEAMCLIGLAGVEWHRSDYQRAMALCQDALPIFRKINRRAGEAICLKTLARVAQRSGDYEQAELLYRQSFAIYTELGSPREQEIVLERLVELAKLRESAE